jgi:Uma2 family endonuclease
MITATQATIEDLYRVPEDGKAELVNGEIVLMSPTGGKPGYAGDEIFVSLREHARRTGRGRAVSDNKGFQVDLAYRKSFSPDAALYIGPNPGMRFYEGAPIFAVEVRSENDYGPVEEQAMRDKRMDYFAAGTLVVWDVGVLSDDVIKVYRSSDPDSPTIYRRGEVAEAEPGVLGWRFPVDSMFESV